MEVIAKALVICIVVVSAALVLSAWFANRNKH